MRSVVVFTCAREHWLAKALRPGYQHVFCSVPCEHDEKASIIIDLTARGIEVWPVQGDADDLCLHYRKRGDRALTVDYRPGNRHLLPSTTNSCVGMTKQLLGIRSAALTPYQLFRHLAKETS